MITEEEFSTKLAVTPACELEMELLTRAIHRTHRNITTFEDLVLQLKFKLQRQKLEMIKLMTLVNVHYPGQLSEVWNSTIREEKKGGA